MNAHPCPPSASRSAHPWRRGLALLVILGVASFAVPAQATLDAVSAQSVTALGASDVHGELLAWRVPSQEGLQLTITASQATLRSSERGYLNITGGRLLLPRDAPKERTLQDVQVHLHPWQRGRVAAWAAEGQSARVAAQMGDLRLASESRICLQVDANYTAAVPRCVPTRGGGLLTGKASGQVTLTGDFSLILMGWNLTGESGGASLVDWSGLTESETGRGRVRQLELVLHDASLSVPASVLATAGPVLSWAVLATDGTVAIQGEAPRHFDGHVQAKVSFGPSSMLFVPQGSEDPVPQGIAALPQERSAMLATGAGSVLAAVAAGLAAKLRRPRDPVLRALRAGKHVQAVVLEAGRMPPAPGQPAAAPVASRGPARSGPDGPAYA